MEEETGPVGAPDEELRRPGTRVVGAAGLLAPPHEAEPGAQPRPQLPRWPRRRS
jgi:hypothetical protein